MIICEYRLVFPDENHLLPIPRLFGLRRFASDDLRSLVKSILLLGRPSLIENIGFVPLDGKELLPRRKNIPAPWNDDGTEKLLSVNCGAAEGCPVCRNKGGSV